MDTTWVVGAIIIGLVFYVAYTVWNSVGLFSSVDTSNIFGAAFVMGGLLVITLLAKPLFFPKPQGA